jgi:hypothetical protein
MRGRVVAIGVLVALASVSRGAGSFAVASGRPARHSERPAIVAGPACQRPVVVSRAVALVPARWLAWYQVAGRRAHVPWRLLLAQDWVESRLRPRAIRRDANGSVDRGLAQINSAAHPTVSPAEAFNPRWAIAWQARTMAALAATCGGWAGALACYNGGAPLVALPAAVRPRVQAYVAAVWRVWQTGLPASR